MIKRNELGVAVVDCGDVVVLPIDALQEIWLEHHKVQDATYCKQIDDWIKSIGGVHCRFACDGAYGVDSVTVVTDEYEPYRGVLIGGPLDRSLRLLRTDEKGSEEFTSPLMKAGSSIDEAYAKYAEYLKSNTARNTP